MPPAKLKLKSPTTIRRCAFKVPNNPKYQCQKPGEQLQLHLNIWYCKFHDRHAKARCQAFAEWEGSGAYAQCSSLAKIMDERTGKKVCKEHVSRFEEEQEELEEKEPRSEVTEEIGVKVKEADFEVVGQKTRDEETKRVELTETVRDQLVKAEKFEDNEEQRVDDVKEKEAEVAQEQGFEAIDVEKAEIIEVKETEEVDNMEVEAAETTKVEEPESTETESTETEGSIVSTSECTTYSQEEDVCALSDTSASDTSASDTSTSYTSTIPPSTAPSSPRSESAPFRAPLYGKRLLFENRTESDIYKPVLARKSVFASRSLDFLFQNSTKGSVFAGNNNVATTYEQCNVCLEKHIGEQMRPVGSCRHRYLSSCLKTVARKGTFRRYNCASCKAWIEEVKMGKIEI